MTAFWIMLKFINPTQFKALHNLVLAYSFSFTPIFFHSKTFFLDYWDCSIFPKLEYFLTPLFSLYCFHYLEYSSPHLCMVKFYTAGKVHFKCYLYHHAFPTHPDLKGCFLLPLASSLQESLKGLGFSLLSFLWCSGRRHHLSQCPHRTYWLPTVGQTPTGEPILSS